MTDLTRRKALAVAAAAGAALLLLDRAAVRPAWAAWRAADVQLAAARARRAREERLLARKDEIRKGAGRLAGARKAVDAVGGAGLLKEIEAAARASGADIRDLKPRPGREGFSVQLVTESSWEALARFLDALHKSPRPLRIDKASIRLKSETSPVISAQLVVAEAAS